MRLKTGNGWMMLGLACAAVMTSSVLVGPAMAKERFVACPLAQANTGLVHRVTHPWWSTPQLGNLVSVHVSNVGGQPSLVCNYRAYNKTMPVLRRFPKNVKYCEPQANGFRCW